jgi:S-adenosylmethionine:tRNA ribosyltransferase-isomerase
MEPCTDINLFDYPLSEKQIAVKPVLTRDESRLLIYHNRQIAENVFKNIGDYLTEDHLLVFNNTAVMPVRIVLRKPTGAQIEFFCLSPARTDISPDQAWQARGSCVWKCYIGNNKRLNAPLQRRIKQLQEIVLHVERIRQDGDAFDVRFEWTPQEMTFAQVLEAAGKIPLPPYIKRPPTAEDRERYQTVYAQTEGSSAAPTAGLHFTTELIDGLNRKGISTQYLTLHVGAGTFKPVTVPFAEAHPMHAEMFSVNRNTVESLLCQPRKSLIAVGTTSARTLESLFWIGVKLAKYPSNGIDSPPCRLSVGQWQAYNDLYQAALNVTTEQALNNILKYMDVHQLDMLHAETSLMIMPYYRLRMVRGLITNFHQPKSTLLLLVSAFTGQEWKRVYDYALQNDFRFLSYGDACLFL